MKKRYVILLSSIFCVSTLLAQQNANNIELRIKQTAQRKNILIPNIEGYQTLKGDFHIHTVFSDGLVWPIIRIQECWAEGIDVMAITDHLEYRPHKAYMQKGHNHSYNLAISEAKKHNILLIKAAEITREMPPGHLNALYINDADALHHKKVEKTFEEVKEQNALLLWNHPGWKAQQPDTCLIYEVHQKLIKEGLVQGMEVMNYNEWYPIVLQWCIDYNLAVFANSDIHGVTGYVYDVKHAHRPMTLLFAKERTQKGVREAIESARTIAWFDQQLAGPEELIKQLFKASVTLKPAFHTDDKHVYMELSNSSDMQFEFINETKSNGAPASFTLQPRKTIVVRLTKSSKVFKVTLDNCHIGMDKKLQVDLM
ncbi:Sb-PDE family phosphodiesterase [Carboxylicivirga marina]|uniref:Sb-PDE family phosphodiesterase n=1 Tax=Carboxylicivirga marina TaxID=2800988 RepID=UPI00259606D8|nr:Sb-PDE family phosphodiesterase [uncultured Carboxylicivirga sp.]